MELRGDGAVEKAYGVLVQVTQKLGHLVGGGAAWKGEIPVQDKLGLWVLLAAAQQAGPGVDLHADAPLQGQLRVHGGLADLALITSGSPRMPR